jgi:DNA-binding transcriptional MerR regulator
MKAPDAFRIISEVAEDLDLPQHVLRFWETRFRQVHPMKRGGGRRYYRPDDVDLLRGIRLLLYGEGFTIKGVQRLLKEKGTGFVTAVGQTGSVETVTLDENGNEADIQAASPSGPVPMSATGKGGSAGPGLSKPQQRQLEGALSQLMEAKRLLDQVR